MQPQQLIAQLASMPDALESMFSEIPRERLNWLPADLGGALGEVFAPLSHACHVRDIEVDGYHVRIRRMLEEQRPDLVSIDGDALARERHYERQDLQEVLRAFRRARERT